VADEGACAAFAAVTVTFTCCHPPPRAYTAVHP
jgi:hypothetical protein